MAAKKAEAEQNDLKVLVPEVVTWMVGDRTFDQTPATLDRLADIMDVIVDEVLSSGNSELLDKLMDTATSGTDEDGKDGKDGKGGKTGIAAAAKSVASDREMISGLVRLIATLPRALPRISAAILDAPEDYLRANLRPKEAFGILRTFIKQNDVGSIIRDFSELFQEFKTEMKPDESQND